MKVYGVVRGEYPDYTIEEMFSTKEKAESYKDVKNSENENIKYYIQEWELDKFEK